MKKTKIKIIGYCKNNNNNNKAATRKATKKNACQTLAYLTDNCLHLKNSKQ